MSIILKKAKEYQRNRDWYKAVQVYQQYIDNNTGTIEDQVYVDYAKCLRVLGKTDEVKKILQDGSNSHPRSERILREYYNLYDFFSEWDNAKLVAYKLIELSPKQANYYFWLGRAYSGLNNNVSARESYKKCLETKNVLSKE